MNDLNNERILVTGGAGFIGSAVLRRLIRTTQARVLNLDKITYAGDLLNVGEICNSSRYQFEQVDIADAIAVQQVIRDFKPTRIMHLAAESHVDRSIDGPAEFIQTNIFGSFVLLEAARAYYQTLTTALRDGFMFHHISTDEVYGSLGSQGRFSETTAYRPNSPYSASKAASDHLVRAWYETYGLPTVISNCSNNYGPYQYPEKLLPVVIMKALHQQPIPVYGRGQNVRDWLFVDDHAAALILVATRGQAGEVYNVGGDCERNNLEVVHSICTIMDRCQEQSPKGGHASLITFVADRPGHDLRYAIDAGKITRELGWQSATSFDQGLQQTVAWYLAHQDWCQQVMSNRYQGQRLGLEVSAGEST